MAPRGPRGVGGSGARGCELVCPWVYEVTTLYLGKGQHGCAGPWCCPLVRGSWMAPTRQERVREDKKLEGGVPWVDRNRQSGAWTGIPGRPAAAKSSEWRRPDREQSHCFSVRADRPVGADFPCDPRIREMPQRRKWACTRYLHVSFVQYNHPVSVCRSTDSYMEQADNSGRQRRSNNTTQETAPLQPHLLTDIPLWMKVGSDWPVVDRSRSDPAR